MATLRFVATCVYKRKDRPLPISRFFGGLFQTISGYFSDPTIPPYNFKTLHFVECRLCRQQWREWCDSGRGQSIMDTILRRCIFHVGPPLAKQECGGPTNRWHNKQWSDNKILSWCNFMTMPIVMTLYCAKKCGFAISKLARAAKS